MNITQVDDSSILFSRDISFPATLTEKDDYLLVLCLAINPSRLSFWLPFRSNTNDAANNKAKTKDCPVLPARTRLVPIIANCMTAQTDANLTTRPKMKDTAPRVSRRVKKYVRGRTMLDPNRFRTKPFAIGCPTTNATHRGITEFNQKAATTTLSATKPYPLQAVGFAKRNERNLEVKSKYPFTPQLASTLIEIAATHFPTLTEDGCGYNRLQHF